MRLLFLLRFLQKIQKLVAAKEAGIKVFHRSDIVAFLMNHAKGIAVAGAHGKTTTTSMASVMLDHTGKSPTIIIGGEVDYFGSNAKLGESEYLVAEADESDGSFLKLSPQIAIVTNIENDHMDFYGSMENVLKTFKQFLNNLPKESGLAILCFDNAHIRDIAQNLETEICVLRHKLSCGLYCKKYSYKWCGYIF